jgi:hypothetical protein
MEPIVIVPQPSSSYPLSPAPRPGPPIRKILRLSLVAGAVLLAILLFFLKMSFLSASDLQAFQKNLENGEVKSPVSAGNPFHFLQVSLRSTGAKKFKEAVENYDGRLEPLKDGYPDAVSYLAYNPDSSEILSMVAHYYFLSGSRLPAETLALKAVALDPYDLTARRAPVLCQALHFDQRERLMAGTWEIIRTQKQFLGYFLKVKGGEKPLFFLGQFLGRFLAKKGSDRAWLNFISWSGSDNEKKLVDLEKEEDWLKCQYAFGLFLTDQLRWKEDARDCLDDEAVKTDPGNLEYQLVVNAWVAEWMEDPALIAAAKANLDQAKLADPVAQKRLWDFKTAFEAGKGYDQQMDALKVYDCLHDVGPVWTRLENDALLLPKEFQAATPEPEGASDYRDWLDKIASGEESPAPGRTKGDYVYPQFAEVKQTIDDALKQTATMPVCPILLPLRDAQGRFSPLGAYLSVQAMTSACFPGRQALSFWAPFSTYNNWRLLGHSGRDNSHLLQELTAETGAASWAEGTLLNKGGGWEATLHFNGGGRTASYSKPFKKNQLHLIPGWMAQSLHAWLGTRLSKAQKASLKKPIFGDDQSLAHGLVLESLGTSIYERVPGWDGVRRQNPKSPFVLFRDFYTQKNFDGVSDLHPMEALVKKDPRNDLAKFFLLNQYHDEGMYGKSLGLMFDFLSKDQTNTNYYSTVANSLEALGDYMNTRYLYEKMAARFPDNGRVQEALGQFYVDYAWVARGGGWGESVSPWNGFLMDKRLALARKYLEKARALDPQDSRIYCELLEVGKGQGWKNEELDQVFNQSVSNNPDYFSSYSERLDMTMEKWGGSNDEMLAFARKWQTNQPWLVVQALDEEARNQTDGKDLQYYRYLSSPKVWPEYNGAYQNYFKVYSMDDYPTWVTYAYDAAAADKVQDFLAFLRAQGEKDETLRYFTPYLVNLVYDYRAQVVGWDHTGQLYLNTPEVWPEIHKATLQVIQQDPDNYPFLNNQALQFAGWGRFKSAREVFRVIGDHWVPKVGTREKFEQYKRIAYSKEKPTWHLCLSTAELAAER